MSGTYEHFIYTDKDASALARAYQDAGYISAVRDELIEGYQLVMVYCDLDKHLSSEDLDIEQIAEKYGAEYDGGGTYLGPIESLIPKDKS